MVEGRGTEVTEVKESGLNEEVRSFRAKVGVVT